mmetsp:Transcript_27412/g.64507  ORF Transcript_27412/g.64507 Transcript_27412/m.64507 type:complete len:135 (+) Transcript_27412:123-527(+)
MDAASSCGGASGRSVGARPSSQGAAWRCASYGAWFEARRAAEARGRAGEAEVSRLAKPTSFWPYGKDVQQLVGTGNAKEVYKLLGSHDARGFAPRRPPQEIMAAGCHVLRNSSSATGLFGPPALLGSSCEARRG